MRYLKGFSLGYSVCRSLLLWCLLIPAITIAMGVNPEVVQAQTASKQTADRDYQAARETIASGSLFAAKPKLHNALKIYQTLGDRTGQYNCLIELARIDYKEANYQQAQIKQRQALQVVNYSTNDGKAKTLAGLIALELGDYNEALSKLRVGVHELQIAGLSDRLARQELNEAKIGLGEVFTHQGLYKQAENYLAQTVNSPYSDSHLRRRTFNALGSIQLEIGQYDEALKTFEQAHSVSNTIGDRVGKAKTLENLGRAYQLTGDRNKALKQYQEALGQLRSAGAWSRQVYVLNNLGLLATELGLSNRALEYLQNAEGTLSNSGGVGRVITLTNLGYYYTQRKKYDLARDYLEQALSWAKSNGDRLGEAKALSGLGAIEMELADYQGASQTLESSIKIFESLRPGLRDEQKISLAESQRLTYDLLQEAYIAQNKPMKALTIAERSRARAFIELLAQRSSGKSTTEIDLTPPNIQAIKAIAKNRRATIVNYSIIQDRKGEESQFYIWVVNPQGKIDFRALDLTVIKEQFNTSVARVSRESRNAASGGRDRQKPRLQDYVVSFRGENSSDTTENHRKLSFPRDGYKLLIEPIKDLLPEDPEALVVFIPQDSLFLVPFPALQNDQGKFLIEEHTMQIAPSIQTLAIKPSKSTLDSSQALIVGNPAPMPESLANLPGAEIEAKAIADILNAAPIIGSAATETTIVEKMPQADLIHFATHGLFDENQGLQSSLALSTSDHTEGFLTAEEILDLNLDAELVVLSACNTGRGRITGDGVVGLSRSFLLAGAQSTIVSLWYVPDLPTSALMTDFYRQLAKNPNQPQALRQAMLNTIKEYPKPYQWAAFMLVGQ
ncbi:CHAT domain-containing protein [Waterburya agarophytonicola K14]|uniref:CHAT domain-containing protein n=1 Tax=Waterburya agarophytonicola KI4 TaxID=2874699 RepID=A0A964FFI6_9CYAN|nr:CHAT domain-containing protein [Waterburya agarophytonicola]MCC0177012.1 CHAT domain-containing protein [Waterburya agarophytonicola KI4]